MRDAAADRALLEALQMENDLLSMEITVLRTELESGRNERDDPSARTVSAERLEQLQLAERDLKRLLSRLGSGVPGWFLRRTRAYPNLERRHGAGDGA